jgi:hypothetical protein
VAQTRDIEMITDSENDETAVRPVPQCQQITIHLATQPKPSTMTGSNAICTRQATFENIEWSMKESKVDKQARMTRETKEW